MSYERTKEGVSWAEFCFPNLRQKSQHVTKRVKVKIREEKTDINKAIRRGEAVRIDGGRSECMYFYVSLP